MQIIYIYSLIDPITNDIRYVGKTCNLEKRLRGHLKKCHILKYHSATWIKSLVDQGYIPIMKVIEETNLENWEEREKYWIKLYKEKHNLTNTNEGGGFGGTSNGFKGKKHSKESIQKMKDSRTGISINQNDKNGLRKKKLREYIDKHKKPILQYNLKGEFIKEWTSSVDAGKELNIGHSNITRCCKLKKGITYNYIWRFKIDNNIPKLIKLDFLIKENNEKELFLTTLEKCNNNIIECSKELKCTIRTIYRKIKKYKNGR